MSDAAFGNLLGLSHHHEGQPAASRLQGEALPQGMVKQGPLLRGSTALTTFLCLPPSCLTVQAETIAFPCLHSSSASPSARFWGS